jgi:hypothetical protein
MNVTKVLQGASRLSLTTKRGNKDFYKGGAEWCPLRLWCIETDAPVVLSPCLLLQVPVKRMYQEVAIELVHQGNMSSMGKQSLE